MRLCGQKVSLVYEDPGMWAEGGMGRCSVKEAKIALRAGMPRSVEASTLLHEVLHYIADTNDLASATSETAISVFGNSMLAWLTDNPEIAAEILDQREDVNEVKGEPDVPELQKFDDGCGA